MKNTVKIMLLLFLFHSATACAQKKPSKMNDNLKTEETAVLTTVRQLADLMIKKDTVAMNKILDEHYTLTHITGRVQSKADWFDEVIKESMKYYSATEVSHTITINGNKADVTMRNRVDARIWGSRNNWPLQQKMQLEKRNDKWIILKSVATTF